MSDAVAMMGEIKKISLDGDFEYDVYVPDIVTSDTKVVVYEHGSGGYYNDWQAFEKEFENNGCDAIVIRASGSRGETLDLIDTTLTEYNLSANNVIFDGHSAGGTYAILDAANLIKAYPDEIEAPVISFTDGCIGYVYPSREDIQVLKNGNAVVVAFVQPGYWQIDNYKKLARLGVNVLIAVDKNVSGEFWSKHAAMNASYPSGGLLEFTIGQGELPSSYELIAYNSSTDEFYTVDTNLINDIDSVYELFNISTLDMRIEKLLSLEDYDIKSDGGVVTNYLNNIVERIRESSFLDVNFNSNVISSNTDVPVEVPEVVTDYFNKVSKMLMKIVSLTDAIAEIDVSYQAVDERLSAMIDENV